MMHKWKLADHMANPPLATHIHANMAYTYIRHYALDVAYISPPNNNESMHKFGK
jgi:hypothetical protein